MPAFAQVSAESGAAADARSSTPSEAAHSDSSLTQARELYRAGSVHYDQGRYLSAAQQFKAAQALTASAPLLFNIAQAYRLAGDGYCTDARAFYERYLVEEPAAPNRAEVVEFLRQLSACLTTGGATDERAPETPSPRATKPGDAGPASTSTGATWTTIAGAAGLLLGAGLYLPMRVQYNEKQATCPCEPESFATYEALTNVSYVLIAAGAATAVAGGIWWLTLEPSAQSTAATLHVRAEF
jgi:tetratricopeptide (TPR) repeat protein